MSEILVDTSALIAFFVRSLLVMARRLSVYEIFTFDKHIQQMAGLGIRCVPCILSDKGEQDGSTAN